MKCSQWRIFIDLSLLVNIKFCLFYENEIRYFVLIDLNFVKIHLRIIVSLKGRGGGNQGGFYKSQNPQQQRNFQTNYQQQGSYQNAGNFNKNNYQNQNSGNYQQESRDYQQNRGGYNSRGGNNRVQGGWNQSSKYSITIKQFKYSEAINGENDFELLLFQVVEADQVEIIKIMEISKISKISKEVIIIIVQVIQIEIIIMDNSKIKILIVMVAVIIVVNQITIVADDVKYANEIINF